MDSHNEHEQRTFTPTTEAEKIMYLFIEKLAQVSMLANPMTGGVYPLGVEARQVLLDLQALATPQAATEPASQPATGLRYAATIENDNPGVFDLETLQIVWFAPGYGTMQERYRMAQAEAAALNADSTGQGGE